VTTRPGPSGIKTKGAVAVCFHIFGSSFLFINCHFTGLYLTVIKMMTTATGEMISAVLCIRFVICETLFTLIMIIIAINLLMYIKLSYCKNANCDYFIVHSKAVSYTAFSLI